MVRTFDAGEEMFVGKDIIMCPWVDKTVIEHGDGPGEERQGFEHSPAPDHEPEHDDLQEVK